MNYWRHADCLGMCWAETIKRTSAHHQRLLGFHCCGWRLDHPQRSFGLLDNRLLFEWKVPTNDSAWAPCWQRIISWRGGGRYVLRMSGAMNAATLFPSETIGVLFQSKGPLRSSLAVILLLCCDVCVTGPLNQYYEGKGYAYMELGREIKCQF